VNGACARRDEPVHAGHGCGAAVRRDGDRPGLLGLQASGRGVCLLSLRDVPRALTRGEGGGDG